MPILASDGDLVTPGTRKELPDRIQHPRPPGRRPRRVPDRGLNDANSSPPKRADEIGLPEATAQAAGHRFQQFVADRMSQRVIDALELVDVDVQNRQLFAR